MLLPRGLLDAMLFLGAPVRLIAPLLGVPLLVVVLTLRLLGMLLLVVVVLTLRLPGVLLLVVPVLALLLLSVLLLVVPVLPLLLLGVLGSLLLALRRSMLLWGTVLVCALLIPLCICRTGDSEKQRQNGCAGDSNYFHWCCLQDC